MTEGGLQEATVFISDGIIESVESGLVNRGNLDVEDVGDAVIMPGLIDSHVHINEPGRTEWEGFDTATKAAAAGGITTLVDMPLNSSPVTTTKEAFEVKISAARNNIHVNCGFYGGIIPDNGNQIEELIQSGVLGIKAFLVHSGIDEFPNVGKENLRAAMPIIKKYDLPLLVHAELENNNLGIANLDENPTSYQAFLGSRPKEWEDNAIRMMIELCEDTGCKVHIVHLSSSNSVDPIQQAKVRGLPVSTETCPHYLVFNSENISDGATEYKCAPPIRERDNNELLWQAIQDEIISFIVTDHSPSIPEMKELESGNFKKAWGGIAGLQFSLPAFWTEAYKRGFTLNRLSELMSWNVAKFLQLDQRKGKLKEGYDADLVIWNPEQEFKINEEMIKFRHKVTPYLGMVMKGKVLQTFVNGFKVFDNGNFTTLSKGSIILKET